MTRKRKRPLYAAGIIERYDNALLIARPADAEGARSRWQFPRGMATDDESPEQAMRRIARDQVGVEVEIVVGQPPLMQTIDGREVEVRYFFCGVVTGEPTTDRFSEIRWITKAHLAEYEFDEVTRPVVDWLGSKQAP